MGVPAPQTVFNETDYLSTERDAEIRHVLVDGVLFAMTGASRAHNLIATNLLTALHAHVRGRGCRASSSDRKVRLLDGRRYYYPDIVVSCSDARDESDEYTETRPVLVVEILSRSTAATDRREKRLAYQSLPSLVDYPIVSQDKLNSERFTRDGTQWTQALFEAGEFIELDSVGFELALEDVYADIPIQADHSTVYSRNREN